MISGVLPLFWAISGSSLGGPKSRQGCSGLAPPAGSGNSFYDDRRRGMISSTNLTALTIVNSFSFYRNGGLI
ncbi:hypothetical protein MRB53_036373 [Persea americana]|nr:hypothetical protein MRB53_036373 [Persea americana]